jgi:hypothetical protein
VAFHGGVLHRAARALHYEISFWGLASGRIQSVCQQSMS